MYPSQYLSKLRIWEQLRNLEKRRRIRCRALRRSTGRRHLCCKLSTFRATWDGSATWAKQLSRVTRPDSFSVLPPPKSLISNWAPTIQIKTVVDAQTPREIPINDQNQVIRVRAPVFIPVPSAETQTLQNMVQVSAATSIRPMARGVVLVLALVWAELERVSFPSMS